MSWVDSILMRFCLDLGIAIEVHTGTVIQFEMEHSGTLQLEQQQGQLSLWLSKCIPFHQHADAIRRAMRMTAAAQAPELPVRAGWLAEDQLILFVTLDERVVTITLLHRALQTLIQIQKEVLLP